MDMVERERRAKRRQDVVVVSVASAVVFLFVALMVFIVFVPSNESSEGDDRHTPSDTRAPPPLSSEFDFFVDPLSDMFPSDTRESVSFPEFGVVARERAFRLDPNAIHLNHGSYGAAPLVLLRKQFEYLQEQEWNTQQWFSYTYRPLQREARATVASYINADVESVAILDNASSCVNAVFRTLNLTRGDRVLDLNIAYGMVKQTLRFLSDRHEGVEVVEVPVPFPTTSDEILRLVDEAFAVHNGTIKFATFPHISSLPAFILPVSELVALAHSHGALAFVDGAHALGQVPVDMRALGADFWTGNGHKWLLSPKAAAVLYIAPEHVAAVHPPVISHWYRQGVEREFEWEGTKDYTAHLVLKNAVELRERVTDEVWMGYVDTLCIDAARLLVDLWHTSVPMSDDLSACLKMVRMPCDEELDASADSSHETTRDPAVATSATTAKSCSFSYELGDMLRYMHEELKIFPVLWENPDDGLRYVRLSCQVYNTLDEYRVFGDAVRDFSLTARRRRQAVDHVDQESLLDELMIW